MTMNHCIMSNSTINGFFRWQHLIYDLFTLSLTNYNKYNIIIIIIYNIINILIFEKKHHWKFGDKKCHVTFLKEAKDTWGQHWRLRRIENVVALVKKWKGLNVRRLLITKAKRHSKTHGHVEGKHEYHPLVSYSLYIFVL